jgi:carbon monoxide dehydrogenase subunit G
MQMNDSQRIPAPKEKVWAALNDPEILKQCIPAVSPSKCPRRPK